MFDAVELVFACDRKVPQVLRETLVEYTLRYLQEHGLDLVFDEHDATGENVPYAGEECGRFCCGSWHMVR
jgi:hypothetical protein